jgi:WD40 repeat protein/serine/threonine protein kinase
MSQIDQSTGDPLPPPEPGRVPPLHLAEEARFSRVFFDSPPTIPGYEILGELGHGGMGVVYQARQISLGRIVALKMIRSVDLASRDDRLRFQSEAEMVARLKHPNIVAIYEIGVHEGRPYFSLEYVEGGNLAQRVRGIPQAPPSAAEMVETLARAVHVAHQRGIIHRDLKPANVLLQRKHQPPNPKSQDNEPRMEHGLDADSLPCSIRVPSVASISDFEPKISDFGLAKRLDSSLTTHASPGTPPALLTQTGAVMGTPSYMAPEQAAGRTKEVTPAVDIYSLGAILYELCTGRPPFLAESWDATRDLVLTQEPLPPRRLQPKLPRDLQTICLKCLEKEPRKRFANALELADELRRFLDGKPIRSRPVGTVERVWRWAKRKPALAGLISLAAMTLVAGVIVFIGITLFKSGVSRERQMRAAFDALDKGIALCEEGEGAQGMLWLAHSLELAPLEADDLQQAIRRNIAGWSKEIHSLNTVLADEGNVIAVAFSADGKNAWTVSSDGIAQLWNATTGKRFGRPISFHQEISAVAFSADRKRILTGSERGTAQLWDASTGQPVGPLLRHPKGIHAVAFSSDGTMLLTGGEDCYARLWDAITGEPFGKPLFHRGPVRTAAIGPDSSTVLTGGEGVHLWDARTGEEIGQGISTDNLIEAASFSPDGRTFLTGNRNGAALWEAASGKQIMSFSHEGLVNAVAFSTDGKTVLTGGGSDRTARLWDPITGKQVGNRLMHQSTVLAVTFSPNGKKVLTASAGAAQVWDVAHIDSVEFSPSHRGWVYGFAFSPDGKTLMSGSQDGTAQLWEAATGKNLRTLAHDLRAVPFERRWIRAVGFSSDGKTVLTAGADGIIRLWETATGKQLSRITHRDQVVDQDEILEAAFSPDGKMIVTASNLDTAAKLWDAGTKARRATLPHDKGVTSVVFSPDGAMVLTGSADNTARLWDAATGACLATFHHDNWVLVVAFSADGRTAITGSKDKSARLWDVATRAQRGAPLWHGSGVCAVALTPDGRLALTGSGDATAQLWNASTGELVWKLQKHQSTVRRVAFSSDGKIVLTGSYDYTARLSDPATGRSLGPPLRHPKQVQAVAFGPGSGTVLTGCWDGKIRRWNLPGPADGTPEDVVLRIRAMTGLELDDGDMVRVLNGQEWDRCRTLLEKRELSTKAGS